MHLELTQSDVQVIADAVVAKLQQLDGRLPDGKLACSEGEAAELLGVARTVLRDCRRRGEIQARKVGKEYRYSRGELLRFLEG